MSGYTFHPIGIISSCFKEKFATPRQPRLVPDARALLQLNNFSEIRRALHALEGFSHVWIIFVFHQVQAKWKARVRPPRLGGSDKVGLFATRSPHRPNPIGISAVELERVDVQHATLHLKGVDFIDGTPVLDIKPYVRYADAIPRARSGWADTPLPRMKIRFSIKADPRLRRLLRQILRLDPRPGFQTGTSGDYAARLLDYDVHWKVDGDVCTVTEIRDVQAGRTSSASPRIQ
jgi:tRNA-Thr(GGU) m(6)t(6)A37 methyltransferase TsaA